MSNPDPPSQQNLRHLAEIASVFKALSDPTRLAILQSLKSGPRCVSSLADSLSTSQANISKHLHLLLDAGLVSREPRKNQVFYSMQIDAVMPLCSLVCNHVNGRNRSLSEVEFAI